MEAMEEGELIENEEKQETGESKPSGAKRTMSMVEDEEEEVLDIKPPPVTNKKSKRHHKKHKVAKEEKKKKKTASRSPEREREVKIREKPSRTSDGRFPDEPTERRSGEITDRLGPRKDYQSSRATERSSRPDSKSRPEHERTKSYEYKSHSDRGGSRSTYPSKRDLDPKRDRYRSHYPDDGDRGSYSKPREEKRYPAAYSSKPEDARSRIERIREESKPSSRLPLIIRKYDEDKKFERSSGRSKHDRSASDFVVPSSSRSSTLSSSSSHSRRSESDLYKRSSKREREPESSRPDSSSARSQVPKRVTQERVKVKKVAPERSEEFVDEIVSSEESSGADSSGNSESGSSGEEEVETAEGDELMLKSGQVEVDEEAGSSSDDSSSSSEGEEEGDEEEGSGEEVSDEEGSLTGSNQDESTEESESEADPRSKFDSPEQKEDSESEEVEVGEEFEEDELVPSPEPEPVEEVPQLPFYFPAIQGCRSVDEFTCLNRIEEGTYGVVYRAKDRTKGHVVALKRLKMEKEREGFPITSLREVSTLLKAHHPNIVKVLEIVMGSDYDKIYIVMEYVEHDLKSLMETMKQPFLVGEVKTLMIQFLRGVHHLHDNWILHRDLKTSNLLLSHRGILKIGDFGLAREYGSPLKPYTPIVVTLWYRSPELLLGVKEYSCAVDMWSVGCIFAEFLSMKPLFPGKSEIMQLNLIFKELGTPTEKIWPGYGDLPMVKKTTFAHNPYNVLRKRFGATDVSQVGFDLLNKFLAYCPERRITALDALDNEWFRETPKPVEPSMFPTWPAKSEQARGKKPAARSGGTPKAPEGAMGYNKLLNEEEKLGFQLTAPKHGMSKHGTGFSLRF